MIATLRGILILKRADHIVLEAGGIGYHVSVPVSFLSDLPEEGSEVFLHIYTHVREDALQLYGFPTEHEKKIFMTLLGVTGVGPKMAVNILSGIPVNDFLKAIDSEDVALLCRVPGLGKKTAHRLILELREKIPAAGAPRDRVFEDTLSALVNFGYRKAEAQAALEMAAKKGYTQLEVLLRESLKYLTGSGSEKG